VVVLLLKTTFGESEVFDSLAQRSERTEEERGRLDGNLELGERDSSELMTVVEGTRSRKLSL
jgi:hypothetical protein